MNQEWAGLNKTLQAQLKKDFRKMNWLQAWTERKKIDNRER